MTGRDVAQQVAHHNLPPGAPAVLAETRFQAVARRRRATRLDGLMSLLTRLELRARKRRQCLRRRLPRICFRSRGHECKHHIKRHLDLSRPRPLRLSLARPFRRRQYRRHAWQAWQGCLRPRRSSPPHHRRPSCGLHRWRSHAAARRGSVQAPVVARGDQRHRGAQGHARRCHATVLRTTGSMAGPPGGRLWWATCQATSRPVTRGP